MADIIAVLIVFGLLAALVGTLATGLIRIIGFGVLVALALIIAGPMIRDEIGGTSFGRQSAPTVAPADIPSSAQQAPTSTGGPLPSGGTPVGGPAGTAYQTTGGTTGSTSRGVRAMW